MTSRISLFMDVREAIVALSDGNPGAINVMMQLHRAAPLIDLAAGPIASIAPLLNLDSLSLYGPSIWCLYKDVCGQDIETTLAVLRGWQLGRVKAADIRAACNGRRERPAFNVADVLAAVKADLKDQWASPLVASAEVSR